MELVIASSNVHKIREFRSILKKIPGLDLLSLLDFPHFRPAQETGRSFEENALQKAKLAALALNKWVIADDSGLVVPSINGAPGIHSARYAGMGTSDKENRQKLLRDMSHLLVDVDRAAYFECWIVLASPEGVKKSVRGTCEGMITTEERGSRGFGYDSLFIKYDYSKTFAEMDEETKNRISHRRKALDKIATALESLASLRSM